MISVKILKTNKIFTPFMLNNNKENKKKKFSPLFQYLLRHKCYTEKRE